MGFLYAVVIFEVLNGTISKPDFRQPKPQTWGGGGLFDAGIKASELKVYQCKKEEKPSDTPLTVDK